jgi:SAM-dependent methyltransferase
MNHWKNNTSAKQESWQKTGRAEFFYEQIVEEIQNRKIRPSAILDIGCGGGFHHRSDLQESLGSMCDRFIGVEPDPEAKIIPRFDYVHKGLFTNTGIPDASIDVAFAVMVLEHVESPQEFFAELSRVMKPGGVFFGFTVDARHWFSRASTFLEKTHLKEGYLRLLKGRRGVERYENFPTAYRCNRPNDLQRDMGNNFDIDCVSLHRVGQLDFYIPSLLQPISHLLDRASVSGRFSGSCLMVRAERRA